MYSANDAVSKCQLSDDEKEQRAELPESVNE